jgi:hypothetical protein
MFRLINPSSGPYYNNNSDGSTALYGPGPPLSEVTWSAHLWQFGDQPTGRAVPTQS